MKTDSQIIRVLREEESVVQLISRLAEDGRQVACPRFSYYFLMPKTRIKRGHKGNHPRTLCAFGPFQSADHARFISISAYAFGLAEEPGSQSISGEHQKRPSEASTREDNSTDNHTECSPARPLSAPVVQLARRRSDASHAA